MSQFSSRYITPQEYESGKEFRLPKQELVTDVPLAWWLHAGEIDDFEYFEVPFIAGRISVAGSGICILKGSIFNLYGEEITSQEVKIGADNMTLPTAQSLEGYFYGLGLEGIDSDLATLLDEPRTLQLI